MPARSELWFALVSAALASACATPLALRTPTETLASSSEVDPGRPYACRFEYEIDDLGPDPAGSDWTASHTQLVATEIDAVSGALTVDERDWAGVWTTRLRTGDRTYAAVGARGHGEVAVAFSSQRAHLAFATTAMHGEYAVISEHDAVGPSMQPRALIPVSDGWWIVALATWQTQHFAWAPPEWRFLHVATDGRLLGRVHARWGDHWSDRTTTRHGLP